MDIIKSTDGEASMDMLIKIENGYFKKGGVSRKMKPKILKTEINAAGIIKLNE